MKKKGQGGIDEQAAIQQMKDAVREGAGKLVDMMFQLFNSDQRYAMLARSIMVNATEDALFHIAYNEHLDYDEVSEEYRKALKQSHEKTAAWLRNTTTKT